MNFLVVSLILLAMLAVYNATQIAAVVKETTQGSVCFFTMPYDSQEVFVYCSYDERTSFHVDVSELIFERNITGESAFSQQDAQKTPKPTPIGQDDTGLSRRTLAYLQQIWDGIPPTFDLPFSTWEYVRPVYQEPPVMRTPAQGLRYNQAQFSSHQEWPSGTIYPSPTLALTDWSSGTSISSSSVRRRKDQKQRWANEPKVTPKLQRPKREPSRREHEKMLINVTTINVRGEPMITAIREFEGRVCYTFDGQVASGVIFSGHFTSPFIVFYYVHHDCSAYDASGGSTQRGLRIPVPESPTLLDANTASVVFEFTDPTWWPNSMAERDEIQPKVTIYGSRSSHPTSSHSRR